MDVGKLHRSFFLCLTPVFLALIAAPANAKNGASNNRLVQQGTVASGEIPVAYATVTIYQAGKKTNNARRLGSTLADGDGDFELLYKKPNRDGAVLYIVAEDRGPDPTPSNRPNRYAPIRLVTVLGQDDVPDHVTINERTTVATAYAMAQFIDGEDIGGPAPGMPNSAAFVRNLVQLRDGGISPVLDQSPNGNETSTRPTVNTLANILSACVRDPSQCFDLFALATPPGGEAPDNTLDAIINIAHYPGNNVAGLVAYAQTSPVYEPALEADAATNPEADNAINSLVLAVRFIALGPNGPVLNGPGNVAFDSAGNAWVNNNYVYAERNITPVCGSTAFVKFTPTGQDAPGSPFGGDDTLLDGAGAGGIYGAGYGIALDPDENVWLSSFGFQGPLIVDGPIRDECPINNEALAVSVSRFTAAGQRRSPDGNPLADQPGGFQVPPRDGSRMRQPQGIKADAEGNLWVAGCVDGTVTRFNAGSPVDPSYMKVSDNANVDSFNNAFDVAIDGRGHAWVTATGTSTVVEIDRDFQVVNYLDENLNKPMGIASDSAGNLWVSNAAQPNPPCPPKLGWDPLGDIGDDNRDGLENLDASVSLIDNSGDTPKVTEFGRDGLTRIGLRWPWGMAVDGRDNAWVANFAGQRIMHLCGAQQARCPAGKVTGDPISPDNGYFFNGLQRVTGIQIDPSGNVWAANNWINEAFMFPENPGGDHMVVFVGLAGPVRTPLIGPPQQP